MKPFLALLFCACVVLPSAASAEGPRHDGQWLATLRHSVSYEQGMKQVHEKIDFAYDQGAINGALHWETIHGYYLELGRAKGCKTGAPFADGPIRACHPVSEAKPKLLSTSYNKGREQIVTMSMESLYPALVRKVLFVIYDYGYVQGMKHGLRKYNDDHLWTQAYYKACVVQANDAVHEPACADASEAWSKRLLAKLHKQVESHGLPVGKKSD